MYSNATSTSKSFHVQKPFLTSLCRLSSGVMSGWTKFAVLSKFRFTLYCSSKLTGTFGQKRTAWLQYSVRLSISSGGVPRWLRIVWVFAPKPWKNPLLKHKLILVGFLLFFRTAISQVWLDDISKPCTTLRENLCVSSVCFRNFQSFKLLYDYSTQKQISLQST